MKELDKTKVYDLRDLSCKQRDYLAKELNDNDLKDVYWKTISYSNYYNKWFIGNEIHNKRGLINALELFKEMKITEEQKPNKQELKQL